MEPPSTSDKREDQPGDDATRLRQRAEAYAGLIDAVDGIVWEADPITCRFTYVNRQAERLLGYPWKRWLDDPSFWPDHIHPDDRQWVVDFCANATREEDDHQFEYRMIAADGRTVWFRDIVTVETQPDGPPRVRGVMVDITAQKEAEERIEAQHVALLELAKSQELADSDFENFSRRALELSARALDVERISVWMFNRDRTVLRCQELYEKSAAQYSSGIEIRSEHFPSYFRALHEGRAVAADDAHTDPATHEFSKDYLGPLGITSMLDAPLRRSGAVVGVVCHEHVGPARHWTVDEVDFAASVADFVALALESHGRRKAEVVALETYEQLLLNQKMERQRVETELAKVRDQLVQGTRLRTVGQVAASIAHELRNPLAAIGNAAFFLGARMPTGDAKVAEHVAIINHEVQRANRIITDLLEMSRAKTPIKEQIDLGETLRQALDQTEGLDGVEVRSSFDPTPFGLLADPMQLSQVLSNLALNAAQALDGSGTLEVTASIDDGTAVIEFADDGPGVSAENRPRVFEPLFSTKAKGTGLGLAICRQIAERHGGTLALGDAEGRGAVFVLRLPMDRDGSSKDA